MLWASFLNLQNCVLAIVDVFMGVLQAQTLFDGLIPNLGCTSLSRATVHNPSSPFFLRNSKDLAEGVQI
jgi:hypothetical protein